MYTSDINTSECRVPAVITADAHRNGPLKTGMIYLAVSLVTAAAAAVYGLFSHGVHSFFMTYAFMIPLLGGALPHLTAALRKAGARKVNDASAAEKIFQLKDLQAAVITTLTAGSLLKGALDIYGTTNRLLIAYPAAAALMLALSAAVIIKRKK